MADDWISKLTSSIYDAQQNRSNFIGGAEGRALQRLKNIELTIHKAFEGVDYNDENQIARTEKYINNQIGDFKRQYPNQALLVDGLEADSQGILNHYRTMQMDYNNDLVNLKSAIDESNLLAEGGLDAAFSASSFADKTLQESGLSSFLGIDSIVSENVVNDQVLQSIKRNEKVINDFQNKYIVGSPELSGVQSQGGVLGANRFWNEEILPMSFFADTELQESLSKAQTILPFLKNEYISNRYEHEVVYIDKDGNETAIKTFLNPDEKKTVEMFLNNDIDYAQFAKLNGKIEENKKSNQNEILSNTQLLNSQRQNAVMNLDQYFAYSPRVLSPDGERNGIISDGTNHIPEQGDVVITSYQDFITKVINNPDLSQEEKQQYINAFSNQDAEAFELTSKGNIQELYTDETKSTRSTFKLGYLTDILNNTEAQIMENSQKYLSFAPDTEYIYDKTGNVIGSTPAVFDPKPMEDVLNKQGQNYISFDQDLQAKLDEMYLQKGFKALPTTSEPISPTVPKPTSPTVPEPISPVTPEPPQYDFDAQTGETEDVDMTTVYEEGPTEDEAYRLAEIQSLDMIYTKRIEDLEKDFENLKIKLEATESRQAKYKTYTEAKEVLKDDLIDITSDENFQTIVNTTKYLSSDEGLDKFGEIAINIEYYVGMVEDLLDDIERGESFFKIGEPQRDDIEKEIKDALNILKANMGIGSDSELTKAVMFDFDIGNTSLKATNKLKKDLDSEFKASSKDTFDKEIDSSIKNLESQIKNIKNISLEDQANIGKIRTALTEISSAINTIQNNDNLWGSAGEDKSRSDSYYSKIEKDISWMLNYLANWDIIQVLKNK